MLSSIHASTARNVMQHWAYLACSLVKFVPSPCSLFCKRLFFIEVSIFEFKFCVPVLSTLTGPRTGSESEVTDDGHKNKTMKIEEKTEQRARSKCPAAAPVMWGKLSSVMDS